MYKYKMRTNEDLEEAFIKEEDSYGQTCAC